MPVMSNKTRNGPPERRGGEALCKDIEFGTTDGTTLRGWHYLPATSGKHPTIVMAHGLGAVKEMYLDRYAEAFAKAGLASIVYDHRKFWSE